MSSASRAETHGPCCHLPDLEDPWSTPVSRGPRLRRQSTGGWWLNHQVRHLSCSNTGFDVDLNTTIVLGCDPPFEGETGNPPLVFTVRPGMS